MTDQTYVAVSRQRLDRDGVLVLRDLIDEDTIDDIVAEVQPREAEAFYADSTHNVYLEPVDPTLAVDHAFNRQVASSKGLIADDEIPSDSVLREIYGNAELRSFLCGVLGLDGIYPYADELSSINVHFAATGMELGWHFDNSSFAVTLLLQAAVGGARFEYVSDVRDADAGDNAYARVDAILDGNERVRTLAFEPGDLVIFRGRDSLHRVTPTEGDTTRMLAVFAYNDRPGVALSASALETFYGRTPTDS